MAWAGMRETLAGYHLALEAGRLKWAWRGGYRAYQVTISAAMVRAGLSIAL